MFVLHLVACDHVGYGGVAIFRAPWFGDSEPPARVATSVHFGSAILTVMEEFVRPNETTLNPFWSEMLIEAGTRVGSRKSGEKLGVFPTTVALMR